VRPNGYWRPDFQRQEAVRVSLRSTLAIGDEPRIRDRLLSAPSRPSVDFSASGLMTSALPNVLAAGCPRSIATAPSRPRQRNSASSCAPSAAASRNSSRGSVRRTRSSAWKPSCDAPGAPAHESSTCCGAPFSSRSTRTQMSGGTRSPQEARGTCPRRVVTRGTCGGLSDPRLLSRQPTNIPPRGVSLLLDHDLGQVSAPTPFS
jgi:hypothetical protein